MLPSARKRIRSAIEAERGSCVTITVVWPVVLHGLAEELEDLAAGLRVEVAGRLVGEDDGRLRDQRARDRDALLLAAGELGGPVLPPVLQPDRLDQLLEPRSVGLLAGDRQREDDVLLGGEHRQQVEELEDEADVLAPELRQVAVAERGDLGARRSSRCRRSAGRARRGCASASTCPSPTAPSPSSAGRGRPRATRRAARRRRCRPRRSGGVRSAARRRLRLRSFAPLSVRVTP